MPTYLILGNIFSFCAVVCIAISATQKNKKDFMYWQIGDTIFGIFATISLSAYAALIINSVDLIRNICSYKNILTKRLTFIILILGVIFGLYANNLAIIGILPIVASAGYTICVYLTKNDQQMRWALVVTTFLWFIHNFYIQSYPSAASNFFLSFWTLFQIFKNRK
ncbi:MAG: YgjV family protein [Alphaproteobacteria bacterium]|nr:YgjV family protein [Alphaproteobacteria bacterium]